MWMRIRFARFTVRGPTGVGNAGAARQRILFETFGENRHLAGALAATDFTGGINHRNTGGIVSAIFQTTQAFNENACYITFCCCAYNATHKFILYKKFLFLAKER
jgi:hypothetical protein